MQVKSLVSQLIHVAVSRRVSGEAGVGGGVTPRVRALLHTALIHIINVRHTARGRGAAIVLWVLRGVCVPACCCRL